jgi:hypothetical protein
VSERVSELVDHSFSQSKLEILASKSVLYVNHSMIRITPILYFSMLCLLLACSTRVCDNLAWSQKASHPYNDFIILIILLGSAAMKRSVQQYRCLNWLGDNALAIF